MSSIPAAIQGLLTLLGSCACAPSHCHVVSVHHANGRVESHPSSAPAPASTLTAPLEHSQVNFLHEL